MYLMLSTEVDECKLTQLFEQEDLGSSTWV